MLSSLFAVLLAIAGQARAIDKVIPPGHDHGSNWRSNGFCGRRVSGWILQIEVTDESTAIPVAVDAILKAHPLQLAPGCSFIGGWRGGIASGTDLDFHVTRWIPESMLEQVIKQISSFGAVRYLDELQSQGTFDESVVKEYERAEARWKDDPMLDWDPVEKRVVREQIQYLGPKVHSFAETRDMVPLHVVVVRKQGLKDLSQGPSPEGIKDYSGRPTWLGLEARLKSRQVEERRKAAYRLTRLAKNSFEKADVGGIGLVLACSSGTVSVAEVDPESPIQGKISTGDLILSVNGEPIVGNLEMAIDRLRGEPEKNVSVEIARRDGVRTKLRVRRTVIFPSAERFEDTVFKAIRDKDSIVAELAIQATQSPSVNRERGIALMKRMVSSEAPRVRLAAIQALQFLLWNGTKD